MKSKTKIDINSLNSFRLVIKSANKFLNDLMDEQKNKNDNFVNKKSIIEKELNDGGRNTKGLIV